LFTVLTILFVAAPVFHAQRTSEPSQLPVHRVILYKSGVGFFEHLGPVSGAADVAIQFTTGQLNDVLKSLAAVDLDGGRIANVSYNSIAPMEQRLGALRIPLGEDPTPIDVYNALRGARIEVRTAAGAIAGRLLGVERHDRQQNGGHEPVDELTLVTDEGSIRTFTMGSAVTVHLGERDMRDGLSSYLDILASTRDQDVRRMVITTAGTGTRRLLVSYISEVPVWKSTYRLVLPEQASEKPLLQGWAIVDNTIGEDWTNVELSLVAGAPQSFIQQISQPYYVERPVVPLPRSVQLQPQTHAPTLASGPATIRGTVRDGSRASLPGTTVRVLDATGRTVSTTVTDADGDYSVSVPAGSYEVRFELTGFNSGSRTITLSGGATQRVDATLAIGGVSETVNVAAEGAPPAAPLAVSRAARGGVPGGVVGGVVGGLPRAPSAMDRAASVPPAATAQDLGDLYEYRLKQPVTIRKNQSAMVPILNAPITAERVSLWTRGAASGRPLRAVWLTNSTGLTLDGGTFSVVDANAFAGEGLIEPLKPSEKRLVSYGADLGMVVSATRREAATRFTKIVARDGIVSATREDRATWDYRVRNEDTTARTLVIEHPLDRGWSVGADPAPVESSESAARFRVAVAPKQETTLTVTERRPGQTTYRVTDVDDRTILVLVQGGAREDQLRRVLQPILAKRAELAAADARLSALGSDMTSINQDQQRIRENMKALKGSSEEKALLQRYTRQLNDQEDRLAALQSDVKKATAERDQRRNELGALAGSLTFEIQ
jgi:hypothetical protein